MSNFFKNNQWLWLLPITIILLLKYCLKHSLLFKNKLYFFLIKLPLLGNILKKILLARFARNLSMTLSAGISLLSSLKIMADTTHDDHYSQAIHQLLPFISSGQPLYTAMHNNPLFLPMAIQMTKIGEESGQLISLLKKIAHLYESDIDYLVTTLGHLLEPLIMIILGVVIGGLVIAMYLPIFKLGTVI